MGDFGRRSDKAWGQQGQAEAPGPPRVLDQGRSWCICSDVAADDGEMQDKNFSDIFSTKYFPSCVKKMFYLMLL